MTNEIRNSDIRELTVDELELASGGAKNLSPYIVTELGMMAGFIKAGGTIACSRSGNDAVCTWHA